MSWAGITMQTATATASLGSNSLTLAYTSGTVSAYIEGIESYNSIVKSINIFNCGWWGSASGSWIGTANIFSPQNMIAYLAPALTIIIPGINEWGTSVAVSTFIANIQALITTAKASWDCLIMTPTPNNTNTTLQAQYVTALYALAAANGIVIIDVNGRWVNYMTANALGLYSDGLHPNTIGYADQAAALSAVLAHS